MKKKIYGMLVIVIILGIALYLIYKNMNNEHENEHIIAESSVIGCENNHYAGTVICDNGIVYTFDLKDCKDIKYDKVNLNFKKHEKLILDNKKYVRTISEDKLKQLKYYSETIKYESIDQMQEYEKEMYDESIAIHLYNDIKYFVNIWDYKSKKQIPLKTLFYNSSSFNQNSGEHVNELIDLIQECTKDIEE